MLLICFVFYFSNFNKPVSNTIIRSATTIQGIYREGEADGWRRGTEQNNENSFCTGGSRQQ